MENAASNANGAATGFMGLGMMNAGAGGMVSAPLEYVKEKNAKETKKETVEGTKCPECGSIESGKFCSKCGKKLNEVKHCTNCGEKVTGKFCANCGTKVE